MPALARALDEVVRRHEILRTTYDVTDDGEPVQLVRPQGAAALDVLDLSTHADPEAEARRVLREEAHGPFDLARGPIFRFRLLRLATEDHLLLLTIHHVACDGWSIGVLARELDALYDAFRAGRPSPLPDPPIQYADYAIWQREQVEQGAFAPHVDHWKARLAALPPLDLPTDRPRPDARSHRGGHVRVEIPREATRALRALAAEEGATPFMAFAALWQAFLHHVTGQKDFAIGVPISGREQAETQELLGFFVNTLALRADFSDDPTLRAHVRRARQACLDAFAHQAVPFDLLVNLLRPERDVTRAPLVQAMLAFDDQPPAPASGALRLEPVEPELDVAKLDLTLAIRLRGDEAIATLEHDLDLIDAPAAARLARRLAAFLAAAARAPDARVGDLSALAPEDEADLAAWREGPAAAFDETPVPDQVAARARAHPDAPALAQGRVRVSYGELDARASRLARRLVVQGVKPGDVVAVLAERSPAFVVGALAAMRAGAAYLPLDPAHPDARLAFMVQDARVAAILAQRALLPRAPPEATVLLLEEDPEGADADAPLPALAPDAPAYVIYTSGSTGTPKGVVVPHRALCNLVAWHDATYGLCPGARASHLAGLSFDASVWETWPALAAGAALHLPEDDETRLDPPALRDWLVRERVSVAFAPTPLAERLLDLDWPADAPLRWLLTGGDLLRRAPAKPLPFRLANHYGPTEGTVLATACEVPADGATKPPIGRPIPNARVELLDAQGRRVPPGAPGEICLGGVNLALGYLRREDLTRDKFVPDPHRKGARLYRTGDLARWRADGALEFLGRLDEQVKIRGVRVEPAEIEAALAAHPDVRVALVVARATPSGHKRLVGYVVPREGAAPDALALRAWLGERLPEHLVPSALVPIAAIPLTPNGKVDHARLPAPDAAAAAEAEDASLAPRTPAEETLARVWRDVLGVERVGAHDNFFELGGDSILSIQVVARAARQGLRLTTRQVFQHQTLARLAMVAERVEDARADAEQGVVTGEAPLTPIQHWFLAQDNPDPTRYNQSFLLRARPDADPRVLERATRALLLHHDALRATFARDANGAWTQRIAGAEAAEGAFVSVDLSRLAPDEARARLEAECDRIQGSFDLARGPLLRVALFDLGSPEGKRLLVAGHHLAVDGVSWRILLEDLETACAALARDEEPRLPPKTTSWPAWGRRLEERAAAPDARAQAWLDALAAVEPLPCDGDAPDVHARARRVEVTLDAEETRLLLGEAHRAYRAQANDVLITALAQAHHAWTGRRSLVVDVEGHGREDELFSGVDLSRTVGWFTTMHPVRVDLPDPHDAPACLKAVKETLRAVPDRGLGHGVAAFLRDDDLARRLREARPPEIGFNHLGHFDGAFRGALLEGLAEEPKGRDHAPGSPRPHRLDVTSAVLDGRLTLSITYTEGRHAEATMRRLAAHLEDALRALARHVADPDAGGRTPSDFPLARLDQPTLDRLLPPALARDADDVLPLTPLQEGMLFHALLEPGSPAYHEQASCTIDGDLDAEAFAAAWRDVAARHDLLRASFAWEGLARPVQVVRRDAAVPVQVLDWRGLPEDERARRLDALLAEDRARGFDLREAPLLRVTLARLDERRHRMLWSFHHAILDGWSLPVVLGEVLACYDARRRNAPLPALPAAPRFADFLARLDRHDPTDGEAHWREALRGFREPTRLPLLRPADAAPDASAPPGDAHLLLTDEETRRLHDHARETRVTPSTLVQAAWALALARHARADDVLFGATVAGRPPEMPGFERAVGLFLNTIPVRVRVPEDEPARAWLAALQEATAQAKPHEHHALTQVHAWSEVPPATPLFETLVVYENYPLDAAADRPAGGLALRDFAAVERTNYPVTLVAGGVGRLVLKLAHDPARLAARDAERLLARVREGLLALVRTPDARVGDLGVLAPEDEAALDAWGEGPARPFDETPVPERIAARARTDTMAVALRQGDLLVTYGELDARASRLARRLVAQGVTPGDVVALLAERSPDFVVGALAAMKAGAAYLPLDPAHPDARLALMARDARAKVLLARRRLEGRAPAAPRTLFLEEDADAEADLPPVSPDAPAYVIYTSGSTGTPKGVVVPHRALSNLVAWHDESYDVRPGARASHLAGLSFDASVWETWPALAAGATLHLPEDDATRLDPTALQAWLVEEGIQVAFAPTPLAERLLALDWPADAPLRWLLTGGDLLRRAPAKPLPFRLANHYGPTEATVLATAMEIPCDGMARPPIGRPIPNARVELLDAQGRRVPPGSPGEICLGGANLALGYLHRPDLTGEKFVADPRRAGARLYRTGDLARWRDDGQLEFLGRVDEQVKVRGVRVEPAEIEAALVAHPGVASCVVDARPDARGETRLVAYVVPTGGTPSPDALRAHLSERLPDAFVPAAFVPLDALPLTPNGKVDRRALPEPDALAASGPREAPATPVEQVLAGLWADAMGGEPPARDDDFFAMGGHSLVATRLVSRVRATFGVDLPLRALFEAPTLRALARRVEALREGGDAGAAPAPLPPPAPRDAPLPLTTAQQRLWFLHAWEPDSPLYNVPAAFRARGALDPEALEAALRGVVARHEVLRTTYEVVDGTPMQRVHPHADLRLPVQDVADEAMALRLAQEDAARPFDLARGPVLRARLLRLAPDDHVLLLNVHHVAFDGGSLDVLVRELAELYAARVEGRPSNLPPLPAQVADLALAERAEADAARAGRDLAYWREKLVDLPALDLPTDRPRPAARSFRGALHRFALPRELVARLRAWSRREGATDFMTLLAAFQALLHRHSGQADFAVGSPVSGRDRPEAEGLVGFFVNTLVLRADVSGDPTFRDLLARTRATCLDAYAHQRVPFERLVGELAPARDLARSPLFQAMLALTRGGGAPAWPGVAWESLPVGSGTAKFDLTLSLHDAGEEIEGMVEYALDLFDPGTAAALARRFAVLLEAALDAPDAPLSRLPLVTPDERAALLARGAATAAPPPPGDTLHARFEAQARQRPDAEAVACGDERLTYAQLDARADALARRLRAWGVGRGHLVGLCLERSVDVVVGILGILKSGAAYVPLDPASPPERLAFMLEDSAAPLVVTNAALAARLPAGTSTLLVDGEEEPPAGSGVVAEPARPDDLAYVIYTSGSTGKPKGVMVEHRHVLRLFDATQAWFGFDERDAWTLFHSFAFDFSVWEIWGALLHGGRLVVVPQDVARSPDAFHALLRDERVSVLNQTPSAWRQLMAADERAGTPPDALALRYVIFGGEALETASLRAWFDRHGDARPRLVNMYGITETTVHVTYRPLTKEDAERAHVSPLGVPIPDLDLLLLDEHGEPVPEGVPGEIVVGGAGVARGYLNRPDLTAQRFVPDPRRPGARLYRSGDLARWLPDGDLAYLGRADQQVKIRGFRIELGEIEAALLRHEGVAEAAVVAREDAPGDKRLVAYLVPRGPHALPSAKALREALRASLPDHMVPAAFVPLDRLPLTTNGKVDRRALPAPARERPELAAAYVAPATSVERALADAWREALGVARVGRHDNFFELGGDSLLTVKAVVAAQRRGVALKPRMLFERQTLAELAQAVDPDAGAPPVEAEASTLVTLQAGGARTPLFLVHPAGGTVGSYVNLARALGPDQPVHALQSVGVDDDRAPHETIEDMARAYLRDARAIQPRGPYRLGGWSFGGVIAYEMARQLEAEGERVEVLAMLDPGLPGEEIDVEGLAALQKRCDALAEESRLRAPDEEEVKRVRDDLARALAEVGAPADFVEVGLDGVRRYLKVFQAQIRAGWRYEPATYGGLATILVTEQALALDPDFVAHWRPHARDVRVVPVRGSHWTAILDPHEMKLLAERLDAVLRDPVPAPDSPEVTP